ncbi:mediator of RNA polymeras-like protein II transcription subunit 6 [Calycina marina]|uniref:Mediator of RNA polymerase II transcription subunit 6 n=1 Tax=Calycina marina TaxID=1763456 RepID=A0A9P7YYH4_9HELO|nr:mediator of RNA polymeras-like protein II transcription subunit 6 [Calycina marina]
MADSGVVTKETPLDEQTWFDPVALQYEFQGGVHSNIVLYYFAKSPFFDHTSNNQIVFTQCMYTEPHVLGTRQAFEERLKSMSGLEFMVVQAPPQESNGVGAGNGVWTIRKQMRMKRHGQEDEITPIASYIVSDPYIFVAPTIASVMSMRMSTMLSTMNSLMSAASSLPNFSPSLGHTYMPPKTNRPKATESQTLRTSRESSTVPGALADITKATTGFAKTAAYNNWLLGDSLVRSLQFDNEYMDDNPISGEPGNFHLVTKSRLEKEKEKERARLITQGSTVKGPLAVLVKPAITPLKTDVQSAKKTEKSGKTPTSASGLSKSKKKKTKTPAGGESSTKT